MHTETQAEIYLQGTISDFSRKLKEQFMYVCSKMLHLLVLTWKREKESANLKRTFLHKSESPPKIKILAKYSKNPKSWLSKRAVRATLPSMLLAASPALLYSRMEQTLSLNTYSHSLLDVVLAYKLSWTVHVPLQTSDQFSGYNKHNLQHPSKTSQATTCWF